MNAITEARAITAAIKAKTGALVGIAVKQGRFAVTRTTREGGKSTTDTLTGWQSHAECLAFMRQMAG